MYDQLRSACADLAADPDVRVLILRGAGMESFSAGTDFSELQNIKDGHDGFAYESRVEGALEALESAPKPTIGLLCGAAVGGGAAIALACDFRIAAQNLRFGVPIAKSVGNCLSANNIARLIEVGGIATTIDLLYTGRLVDADEALSAGVVHRVVPVEDAEEYARGVARTFSNHAPGTLRSTKLLVSEIRTSTRSLRSPAVVQKIIEDVYSSTDFREGTTAFREHRPPRWRGT